MKFEILKKFSEDNQLSLGERQIAQLDEFAEILIDENKKFNLTAIKDPAKIEVKHMVDSLASVNLIKKLQSVNGNEALKILDVGCGAGFPGIPLAIALPRIQFTLLDSQKKKIKFISNAISKLKLLNVNAVCARAEDFVNMDIFGAEEQSEEKIFEPNKTFRESFDIVVSRAVAETRILLEYCLPAVKVGGQCILYKSGDIPEELLLAKGAADILGGKIETSQFYELPSGLGKRSLVIVKKVAETPYKYPRRTGKPRKNPL